MCNFASIVQTKDRDYWSKNTDSHTEIIAEYGLCESIGNKSPETTRSTLVKVELIPPEMGDGRPYYLAPLDKWAFRVDQDIVPKWYDRAKFEKRARKTLAELFAARVITCGHVEKIESGKWIVCGGTISEVRGGTISEVRGGTISEVCGGTISAVCGGTISEVRGGTISAVCGGTISEVRGGTISAVCGGTFERPIANNATVITFNRKVKLTVKDSAIIIDRSGDVVVVRGKFTKE